MMRPRSFGRLRVLATGNRVVLAGGSWTATLWDTLPRRCANRFGSIRDWIRAPLATMDAVAAVLHSGPSHKAHRLRNELAARDGALVPLILSDERNFRLYRLTVERVVTVNTTAAGGNATLMMLDA